MVSVSAPSVRSLDLGVLWDPNVSSSVFLSGDSGIAELWLWPHFDDPEQSWVVLRWLGCLSARLGPYNDEGRHHHPLYPRGLSDVLWAGEGSETEWLAEVQGAVSMRNRPPLRHFLILLKEDTVEVVANEIEVERSAVPPADGWVHRRVYRQS